MAKDGDLKTILLTSPGAGEGKTTTVADLAVSLAQADKRVIAVSADLRKPRLHRFFNLANDIGVTSVLLGQATLSDAILRPVGVPMLRIVASGPVPPNPAELLGSPGMEALLDRLRGVADFVLIDTPPTLVVSDALVLAPKVDAVVVVADAASTTQGAIQHLRERLEQVGANVIGGVLNDFDPARARTYGYGYGYGYGHYEDRRRQAPAPERAGRRGSGGDGGTQPVPGADEAEGIWKPESIWS